MLDSIASGVAAMCFISFILLIPPFLWHCRCKNVPVICLLVWLMFLDLNGFINVVIWGGDNFYQAWDGKGWCDVTALLEVGSNVGKICAITALALNLYMILSAKNPEYTQNTSWKKLVIDLSICLITPIFIMSTSFIVQISRYDIIKYSGCMMIFSETDATIGLQYIWGVIWSVPALILCSLTLVTFFQKRKDANDILLCTNSGLNLKRFARLLIFCILVIIAMVPIATYHFYQKASGEVAKFVWSEVHSWAWGLPLYLDYGMLPLYSRFINFALSVITFLLFGLGADAVEMYREILAKCYIKLPSKNVKENAVVYEPNEMKTLTNKSNFSDNSPLSNAPTMHEFESRYASVLAEFDIAESPQAGPSSPPGAKKVGLPAAYDTQLQELMRDRAKSGDFSFKFEVRQV
ncbi:STE3 [[Candida] subhashii]|uniref:STE3 n=1 Tax=[Candida] subhashii TaxID=561895 RepID=A0A8J5UT01_9ASCO|nr:STE3 [[Candida] subhashii]KAG7661070.1 STE3 [[Candida] subhashii]